jgi:transposase InsO family protein
VTSKQPQKSSSFFVSVGGRAVNGANLESFLTSDTPSSVNYFEVSESRSVVRSGAVRFNRFSLCFGVLFLFVAFFGLLHVCNGTVTAESLLRMIVLSLPAAAPISLSAMPSGVNFPKWSAEANFVGLQAPFSGGSLKPVSVVGAVGPCQTRICLDTGGAVSLISEAFMHHLLANGVKLQVEPVSGHSILVASGTHTPVLCKVVGIPLSLGEGKQFGFVFNALVLRGLAPSILIGVDTLDPLGCDISMRKKCAYFTNGSQRHAVKIRIDQPFDLVVPSVSNSPKDLSKSINPQDIVEDTDGSESSAFVVELQEGCTLRPGCTDLTLVCSDSVLPSGNLIFDSQLVDLPGISIYCTLERREDRSGKRQLHILFQNSLTHTVRIPKRTRLGQFLSVSDAYLEQLVPLSKECAENPIVLLNSLMDGVSANSIDEAKHLAHVAELKEQISKHQWVDTDLTDDQKRTFVEQTILKYPHAFVSSQFPLGKFTGPGYKIRLKPDAVPFAGRVYRLSPYERRELEGLLDKHLKSGTFIPSTAQWAAPVFTTPKRDANGTRVGSRLVCDFRGLNAACLPDVEHVPLLSEARDTMANKRYISCCDIAEFYHQLMLDPESQDLCSIITHKGKYKPVCVMEGVAGAPAFCLRVIKSVLSDCSLESTLSFFDDLRVASADFDSHIKDVQKLLERLQHFGLRLKFTKCVFAQNSARFLGHLFTSEGVRPDPARVDALLKMPYPTTQLELMSQIGSFGYLRWFIRNFAKLTVPLKPLLTLEGKKNFNMSDDQRAAIDALRKALAEQTLLHHPDANKPFTIEVDASDRAVGCALFQVINGKYCPIEYQSVQFNKSQTNYSTSEKELFGVLFAIKKWQNLLDPSIKHTVLTDHEPLVHVQNMKDVHGRLARWAIKLSPYALHYKYRKGKLNYVADCLSRQFAPDTPVCENDDELYYVHDLVLNTSAGPQSKKPQVPHVSQLLPPEITVESLAREQRNDKTIGALIAFKTSGVLPDDPKLSLFVQKMEPFTLFVNDVLYRYKSITLANESERFVPFLPQCFQQQFIRAVHQSVGHQGWNKTYLLCRDRAYFINMADEIAKFVRSCDTCQRFFKRHPPAVQLEALPLTSRPWERISLDYVGPLVTSARGHKHVLMLVDHHTGFILAKPVAGVDAAELAEYLFFDVFPHYGYPDCILTDLGSSFTSALLQTLMDVYGVRKLNTTPYHPQGNGRTERTNASFIDMLRKCAADNNSDWDLLVSQLQYVYNVSPHKTLKLCPFVLLRGYMPELLLDRAFSNKSSIDYLRTLGDVGAAFADRLTNLFAFARKMRESYNNSMLAKNIAIKPADFKVGDLVVILNDARDHKLTDFYLGPYCIVSLPSKSNAVIRRVNDPNAIEKRINVCKLRHYFMNVDASQQSSAAVDEPLPFVDVGNLVVVHPDQADKQKALWVGKVIDKRINASGIEEFKVHFHVPEGPFGPFLAVRLNKRSDCYWIEKSSIMVSFGALSNGMLPRKVFQAVKECFRDARIPLPHSNN